MVRIQNKQIKILVMSTNREQTQSLQKPAHESIKRGLLKIKQAQIEVMRELRKDDPDYSRNHSLTYSKQTTYDPKPGFRTDGDAFQLKNKLLKVQTGLPEFSNKEGKTRQDSIYLGDEVRKYKEAVQKAQAKMKEYEQSQEKALSKAQNAYSNAIASQKKFISLKGEFDKINKERDRLSNDLKKLQRKELSNLTSIPQNEGNISNKIIKQLISVHDCFKQLIIKVNSHKCPKVITDSKSSPNTSLNSSANSFTISTFQIQESLDKSMAKLIGYFKNLQSLGSIQQNLQNASSGVYGLLQSSNHYLSSSFQQDIKLIEQQLQRGKGANSRHEGDQQQVMLLQNRIKSLIKENQESKQIKNQFESFKIKAKERELQKDLEIEIWKKKQRMAEDSSRRSRNDSDFDRNSSRNSIEILEDRLLQLEKENTKLHQKLSIFSKSQKEHLQTIQKLKFDLELTNVTKQELDTEHSYETKAYHANNAKNSFTAQSNKTQHQWEEIIELVRKLQEEKQQLVENEKKTDDRMQQQNLKYQQIIQEMEQQLKSLRKSIQELQSTHLRENYHRAKTEQAERRNSFGYQPTLKEPLNSNESQFIQNNHLRQIKNSVQQQQLEAVSYRNYTQYQPIYEQQHQQIPQVQQIQQVSQQQQIRYNSIPPQPHSKIVMSHNHEMMPNVYGYVQSFGGYPVHYQVQHPGTNQGMIIGYGGNGVLR